MASLNVHMKMATRKTKDGRRTERDYRLRLYCII